MLRAQAWAEASVWTTARLKGPALEEMTVQDAEATTAQARAAL